MSEIASLARDLWPRMTEAQAVVLAEKVQRYEIESVVAVLKEVLATGTEGPGDAIQKIVARCRANASAKAADTKPKAKAEEWTPPTEGNTPGEYCDMAYAGTLKGPLANATPRGKAWMYAIGEKRERARRENREPFEPSGAELIAAATSLGQSQIGKRSKRDIEAA